MGDPAESPSQVVLITGASRGIGAEVASQLSGPHRHIVVAFRQKARRAGEVVDAIRAAGGSSSATGADLCDEHAVTAMLNEVRGRFGRLDVLVLNASGGMERDADEDYAMRLNRDAQAFLAQQALPLMPSGSVLVFVTSHQAHFHGTRPVPPEYESVAASKRAGEDALRALRPSFERAGVRLIVVSGDMIEGTTTVRLLERSNPEAVAARRAAAPLPTVAEFAGAIVAAIEEPPRDDDTLYVGGPDLVG